MEHRRWKILIVIEATSAGVARHVADLGLNIDLDRFDVTLAYSDLRIDDVFREDLRVMEARGVRTVMIRMTRAVKPGADLRALWQLTRLVRRERFDLVYGESSKAGFLARGAALLAGRSAAAVYLPNSISISVSPMYWYPEKLAGYFTDALVAVTDSEHEQLRGYNLLPASKLHTVTAGVQMPAPLSAAEVAAVRREFAVPESAVLIGTAGRVAPQKDPITFVRTAGRVVRSGLPAYFLWLGDGVQIEEMKRETEARGLSHAVKFAGYRKDARRLLGAVDIFLLTSRYESFGYVTCEAMGAGKPVVGSKVTGTSDVVDDGVTGMLIPAGNDEGFAAALTTLLKDAALRERMGELGRQRIAARFGLPRMVQQTEQLFENLILRKFSRTSRAKPVGRRMVSE